MAEADGRGSLDEDAEAGGAAAAAAAAAVEDFRFSGAVILAEDCLLLAADSVRGICPPWLILFGFIDVDFLPPSPIEDFFGSMTTVGPEIFSFTERVNVTS